MSLSQLIDATEQRRSAFSQEVALLMEERGRYLTAAAELEQQRERNGRELGGYLLPDLDDEDLILLETRLRYPVFMAAKRGTEAELADLDAERVRLEADPRYQQRDVLRVDYENQVAEIADAAKSFEVDRGLWERSKHFQGLRERGWFEPDYDGGIFDWLRDWRACSLLMGELERDFPDKRFPEDEDIKREWAALYAASEPVLQLSKDLKAKMAELDALEARHKQLLAAPDQLYQDLWQRLAVLIVQHLRQAPEELLVTLGQEDETLATFLKKDVGLKKQAAYLRELIVSRIEPYYQQLAAEERKLGAKVQKLRYKRSRGKYVHGVDAQLASVRVLPRDKWSTRRASFAKTRDRLAGFDRWDRGSFVQDFLWWDLMTHGARGDDLYEVRVFHEHHPGWSVDAFRDPLETRDAAADANALAANDLAASAFDSALDDAVVDAS